MSRHGRNAQYEEPSGKSEPCADCMALAARVETLEARVAALAIATLPLPRCSCGRIVTRTATVTHPVGGMMTESLCDTCTPKVPYFDQLARIDYADAPHADQLRGANAALRS